MKLKKLVIKTPTQKYSILIGKNLILNLSKFMKKYLLNFDKCLFVVDKNVPKKQINLIKSKYPKTTKTKESNIVLINVGGKQLYESRFENFSKKEAYQACKRLKKYNRDCFVRL